MVCNLHFPTRTSEFKIWNRMAFQKRKPYQFPARVKTPLTIAPAGARTHDLPHTQTSLQVRSPTPYSFGQIFQKRAHMNICNHKRLENDQ